MGNYLDTLINFEQIPPTLTPTPTIFENDKSQNMLTPTNFENSKSHFWYVDTNCSGEPPTGLQPEQPGLAANT